MLPIPDAALGALGYLADAVFGLAGGTARWRTQPWLVIVFAIALIPFGVTSVTLFILQPVLYNTLVHAVPALGRDLPGDVPYAWDEFGASWQWMRRRQHAGIGVWDALRGR